MASPERIFAHTPRARMRLRLRPLLPLECRERSTTDNGDVCHRFHKPQERLDVGMLVDRTWLPGEPRGTWWRNGERRG